MSMILLYSNAFLGTSWLLPVSIFFVATALMWYTGRWTPNALRRFLFGLAAFLIARMALRIILQYAFWKTSVPGAYLLPPHRSIWYFVGYSVTHHIASLALLTASIAFISGCFLLLSRVRPPREGNLWGEGDVYLFFIGALLVGWPLILPFVMLAIMAALAWATLGVIVGRVERPVNAAPFFLALTPLMVIGRDALPALFMLTPLAMPF